MAIELISKDIITIIRVRGGYEGLRDMVYCGSMVYGPSMFMEFFYVIFRIE